MKQNTFTKLLAAGAACTFALGTAFAQDSTTTTTTAAGSTTVSTSAMDGTGTITTFSPDGNMMTVRTSSSAEPITYYYTPQTVVVDPTGATWCNSRRCARTCRSPTPIRRKATA